LLESAIHLRAKRRHQAARIHTHNLTFSLKCAELRIIQRLAAGVSEEPIEHTR
jgi:hypothetical protein